MLDSMQAPRTAQAAHTHRPPTPLAHHWLDPLVLALVAPLAVLPERFPREAVVLGLALLLVPYGVRLVLERRLHAPSLVFWAILFLVVVVLPLNIWRHPDFWRLGWPELVRLLWGLAACLAVVNWCNPVLRPRRSIEGLQQTQALLDRRVLWAGLGYVVLGLVVVTVGLMVMRANSKIPFLEPLIQLIPRIAPGEVGRTLGFNPNRVAGAAILFLPLTFALLISPFRGLRLPVWLTLKAGLLLTTLFFGGALLITQSRGGLLAGGVALGVVLILAGRRGWVPLTLAALVVLAALEVYGPARLVDAVYVPGQTEIAADATLADRILADRNVAGRLVIWQRARAAIQEQPLTGIGLGMFDQMAQEPYPALPNWRPDADIHHAHNLFLQTGLDLGIPGLMAFVLLVLWAGVGVGRLFFNTLAGSPARFWSIGLLGAWVAFVVYNLLDATTIGARPAITYWVLLGLCIGLGEQVTLFQTCMRHYRAQQAS